jgi:hypothetical protein
MGRRGLTISLVTVGTVAVLLTAAFLTVPGLRHSAPTAQTIAAEPTTPELLTTPPTTSTPSPTTSAPSSTTSTPANVLSASQRDQILASVIKALNKNSPKAELGFSVYDRATGTTVLSSGADTPMYTASVVKLLLAIDSLRKNNWDTSSENAERITEMLEGSNDATASSLWVDDGGPPIIARMAALIGLHHTVAAADPGQWGMAKASPNDIVAIYQYINTQLPENAGQLIMKALSMSKSTADDGFPQRFGIPDGLPGSTWAVKQGWMVLKAALVLNTTGVVGPDSRYVVVMMTQLRAGTSEAKGRTAVTAAIAAAQPAFATA